MIPAIALWILAASLYQGHSMKWQLHTVKFLSFQAPADTQIYTFPDPLPDKKEKPLFTHFLVNLWLDRKLIHLSIDAMYKTSGVLEGLTPQEMNARSLSAIASNSKGMSRRPIVLHSSGLRGTILQDTKTRRTLWTVGAANSEFLVTASWLLQKGQEKQLATILRVLNSLTLRVPTNSHGSNKKN